MSNDSEILPQRMENMSLENEKHEEYERLEDEEGYIPRDPVKMNKSLEYEYMVKFEPWDFLPSTYFLIPSIDHRPSLFVYGFGFRFNELIGYAKREGFCPQETAENRWMVVRSWMCAAHYLTGIVRSEFRVSMDIRTAYSREADVVLRLWDNYCDDIPYPGQQKMFDAIDRVEDILKEAGIRRHPKWYIAEEGLDSNGYGRPVDFTHFISILSTEEY